MLVASYRKLYKRVQGKMAIRVCFTYNRISFTEVLLVLARMPPINMLVHERSRNYEGEHDQGRRKEEKERIMQRW